MKRLLLITLLSGLAIVPFPAYAETKKPPSVPNPPNVRLLDVRHLPIFHTPIPVPLPPKPPEKPPLRPPTRGGDLPRTSLSLASPTSALSPSLASPLPAQKVRASVSPDLPTEATPSLTRLLLFRRTFHRGAWERIFLGGILLSPERGLRYYSTDRTYQKELRILLQESLQTLRSQPSSSAFLWRLRRHLEKKYRLEVLSLSR